MGHALSGEITLWKNPRSRFSKSSAFPAVMVGIMLAAIYRLGAWFAKNVATPLADSHIALVSQLAKSDQMKTDILSRLKSRKPLATQGRSGITPKSLGLNGKLSPS